MVIRRCSDTRRHSLMLSAPLPNNTDARSVWVGGHSLMLSGNPAVWNPHKYDAVTQMSGALCCLCSERQRARAAVSQRIYSSALLAQALISKLFPLLHCINYKRPLTLKILTRFSAVGFQKCIITNSSWGAISYVYFLSSLTAKIGCRSDLKRKCLFDA